MESTRRSSRLAAKPHVNYSSKDIEKEKKAREVRAAEEDKEALAKIRATQEVIKAVLALEKEIEKPTTRTIVEAKGRQLTLAELFSALSMYLEKNPEAGVMPVFHVEFGGITKSSAITFADGEVVID